MWQNKPNAKSKISLKNRHRHRAVQTIIATCIMLICRGLSMNKLSIYPSSHPIPAVIGQKARYTLEKLPGAGPFTWFKIWIFVHSRHSANFTQPADRKKMWLQQYIVVAVWLGRCHRKTVDPSTLQYNMCWYFYSCCIIYINKDVGRVQDKIANQKVLSW